MMKPKLIVALDVPTRDDAEKIVDKLASEVKIFKVGSQLFTAGGPDVVKYIRGKGADVFLDLKFHDIPNTVTSAVRAATALNVFMMTVHVIGGDEMLRSAVKAAGEHAAHMKIEKPKIVGVTVLTSVAAGLDTQKMVVERALSAQRAGLDGVVCSVHEATAVRKACGKDFIIVTPGIRLPEGDMGDQKRVATPADAIAAGSHFLVVGRPVIAAADPLKAAQEILRGL